ncbi:MAG TPA: hypothetical protein VFZ73_11680 [Gemmatimonadaceae bacterium]
MRSWGDMNAGVLLVGSVFGILAMVVPRQQSGPTPMDLFNRMLPAIRHPRCTNCHGVVDPATGRNHPGGLIVSDRTSKDYMSCMDAACHSDAHEWQIPGQEHFFAGRTDKEVCSQLAEFVTHFGRTKFIDDHARKDNQIVLAFKGEMGGALSDTIPKPPQMTHDEFIKAASDWVQDGNAACEPEGVIRIEESITSSEHFKIGDADQWITQAGTRLVLISSGPGGFRADITVDGEINSRNVQKGTNAAGQPCEVILVTRDQYSGRTNGLASVRIKDTVFANHTPHPTRTDYRLDITLPEEKTRQTTVHSVTNGCGILLPPLDNDAQEYEWPEWTYTIEGSLDDRNSRTASGGCNKTLTQDLVAQDLNATYCNRWANMGNANEAWLLNHGAASRYHDGKPIAFQQVFTWNIRRR